MDILDKLREHDGEQIGFVRDAIAAIEQLRRETDIAGQQHSKLHDELEVATARIGNLEAQIDRLRLQHERSQRYWVDASKKALSGDGEHLRLRIDMALAGPIELTETSDVDVNREAATDFNAVR